MTASSEIGSTAAAVAASSTANDVADDADADVDVDLLKYLQTLTPTERIQRNDQAAELVQALREAGIKHDGFDPRAPEATR